ncbi:hypothetical protein ABH942_000599 [Flavobacterium sp. 28YEA47A]|uniref:hypothetical protein n=1 Tax=Flavobacterium sp. 28YEA47A TaxID=3156276 RepID=UPI0035172B57
MVTHTVYLPKSVHSDFEGYDYLIMLIDELKVFDNSLIVFDFKKVFFIEANLCALLGAIFEILETKKNIISVVNMNDGVMSILCKNEFLLKFGLSTVIDYHDTSITYKKFTPNDDTSFREYITTQLINRNDFPTVSKELSKNIVQNIFEIYENARTHGLCEFIHTCGQYYPNKEGRPLYFTIVDKGMNIKENVSLFLKRDISAEEAIKWAMVKGNSTKTGTISGGLGLAIIFEFIMHNKGMIQVISSNGYYEYRNGVIEMNTFNYVFDGTIVNIKFNFNDTNVYWLKEEEENFDNIF